MGACRVAGGTRAGQRRQSTVPLTGTAQVTVPAGLAEQVRNEVGAAGISGFVTEAVERALRRAALRRFLDEMDADDGPSSGAVVGEVVAALRAVDAGISLNDDGNP